MVTGTTNDISQLLYFSFYDPVYYHDDDSPFPSTSKECHGRWVGFSENMGNFMTFKILTNNTDKIIYRSNLCSTRDPNARNLRIDPIPQGHLLLTQGCSCIGSWGGIIASLS
jgi:hypothetical protein